MAGLVLSQQYGEGVREVTYEKAQQSRAEERTGWTTMLALLEVGIGDGMGCKHNYCATRPRPIQYATSNTVMRRVLSEDRGGGCEDW